MLLDWINLCNINPYYLLTIVICVIMCLFISLVFVSYICYKYLKYNVENNDVLFYKHSSENLRMIDKYGDFQIKKLYIIRQPLSKIVTLVLNLSTLYKYEKWIKESEDYMPYHTLIVCEIELNDGMKKWIMIEKNNRINITDTFLLSTNQDMKMLPINNQLTIKRLLAKTQNRMKDKFFRWHIHKNNCQEFTKQLLKSAEVYTQSAKEFITKDKLIDYILPSELTIHTINCLCIFYNIFEKSCWFISSHG